MPIPEIGISVPEDRLNSWMDTGVRLGKSVSAPTADTRSQLREKPEGKGAQLPPVEGAVSLQTTRVHPHLPTNPDKTPTPHPQT